MRNQAGRVIYVGKAKVLKHRVRSYFTGSHDAKTEKMISEIVDFEYILTQSEVEALVLEYNLIKKYQPPYNILLRDGKSYPYILVTAEPNPRILVTRQIEGQITAAKTRRGKAGKYFGPYPSATSAREAAALLNRLFPLRKCRQMPKKPCLYAHIDQCLAPCVNPVPSETYEALIEKITAFLRGRQKDVVHQLEEKMAAAAAVMEFETAAGYRDLLEALRIIREKQAVASTDDTIRDIIGYAAGEEALSVQIFYFRSGKLSSRDSFLLPYYSDAEDAFISFLLQRYTDSNTMPEEICVPQLGTTTICELLPIVIPKRGQLRELVRLANENAQNQLDQKISLAKERLTAAKRAQEELAQLIGLPSLHVIEAFDISNFRAAQMVCGMIQFADGKPVRTNYRKFSIKDLDHPDDRACVKQAVSRRYRRLLDEDKPLPDLVLVDGGLSQVRGAEEALASLDLSIPVAGMVKDDRHRTRTLVTTRERELDLSPGLFHLVEQIQEETHRFAITFHRQKRQHDFLASELSDIPGIGRKRRLLLLRHFGSIDNIKKASCADLQGAGLPQNAARNLMEHFNSELLTTDNGL
ncbi:MAG: excinuclease ABC subunit UvrC [Peptococcaceae bacterium]|nr:excinuclease ABC subunit UvrC [Peptococcaceae bacterium]